MSDSYKYQITLDSSLNLPPTRDHAPSSSTLPPPKLTKSHPKGVSSGSQSNASIYFVGTATTILEWEGVRIMTDPNFLHKGDHVHLGPGVTGTRVTDPAIDLHELPRIDAVLLSHYHADHFDEKVEFSLRRDLPIITTPHAHEHLSTKPNNEAFTSVFPLDTFESSLLPITKRSSGLPDPSSDKPPGAKPSIKVTAMPGKHVPPGPAHILQSLNEFLGAVPPTNGWILELGHTIPTPSSATPITTTTNTIANPNKIDEMGRFDCGYRIYISGDTLLVDELEEIPKRYTEMKKPIDLMLVHLGGTTIPGPKMPLLMITMDAVMGVKLIQLVRPNVTVPVHYDDYDVFLSPLDDFKKEVEKAGLQEKVVYLDRGDAFGFEVKVASPES